MAKSRRAILLALALTYAAPNLAQDRDSGALAAAGPAQRSALRRVMGLECPPADAPGEIVICGSRDPQSRRYRIDPALTRMPDAAAETSPHRQAMDAGSSRCTAVGRDQACNRGLVLMGTGADKGALGKIMGDD